MATVTATSPVLVLVDCVDCLARWIYAEVEHDLVPVHCGDCLVRHGLA